MLAWLEAFLARATKPGYVLEEQETSDLRALDVFLRRKKVPAAG